MSAAKQMLFRQMFEDQKEEEGSGPQLDAYAFRQLK